MPPTVVLPGNTTFLTDILWEYFGSGQVLEKIPGSGSGSGRVGVLKYTIGYFRVSFFTVGYFRVFLGIFGYFWLYWISCLFLELVSQILRVFF